MKKFEVGPSTSPKARGGNNRPNAMDVFNFTYWNASEGNTTDVVEESRSAYKTVEVVFIVLVASLFSLITVIGNILVMFSIKVNRNLHTVNNYFLFSLACADLIIGLCSMNLYTVYIVMGYWPLGPVVCDLWLALDYVVSNASVMNLLIISFDRYFCVTKPLSYPVKRTTKMAGMMIAAAWVLSFILWAPAILFWQFIVGGRTVPEKECYIQFFSNAAITFGTAIAAFYLPVIIMIQLYWQISRSSKSRVKKEHRKTSGANPEPLSPGQRRNNMPKPNNNNIPGEDTRCSLSQNTDDRVNQHDGKLQNGKGPSSTNAEGEIEGVDGARENCAHGEEKESSNDSTSCGVAASNQKEKVAPSAANFSVETNQPLPHPRAKAGSSKLTCIKIKTKAPKGDCYTPFSMETAPATEQQNRVAQKIIKQPPNKKKMAAPSWE
uniref:Muscarinic acetylcholine receptor n=1 Tax=Monopterus albus TaxID=43700 RepID=A0A3Q3RCJ5_MONAL